MRHRLRKRGRIRQAGKKCNTAQYTSGAPKRRNKTFRQDHRDPLQRREETIRWAEAHIRKGVKL